MNNEKIDEKWILCLYIAGMTSAAKTALANIKQLCEEQLEGKYTIEVVDLLERPELAEEDQILAVPTLVRQLPPPLRKIIGDLSDAKKVLVGLDVKKAG
jgi:circadian clock protein KaiB